MKEARASEIRLPSEPWRDPNAVPFIKIRDVSRSSTTSSPSTTSGSTSTVASSFRCWDLPVAARRRCCACWPGFETPDSGTIEIDGVGYVGCAALSTSDQHDVPILRAVSAHDGRTECRFRAQAGQSASAEIARRVEEMLNLVKLSEFARRKPHQLSGGQNSVLRWRARWSKSRRCCYWMSRSGRSTGS